MSRRKTDGDAKGDNGDGNVDEQGIWGTWEELVLACAVSRFGTGRWDSVAVEVGSRAATLPHLLTPQSCRRRYGELRRRYEGVGVKSAARDEDEKDESRGCAVTVPWLDDLRRLRVAELRREVEKYDVSILSLQLKVKKLTEERERSLSQGDSGARALDPDAIRNGESAGPRPSTADSKDDGRKLVDDKGKVPDPDAAADQKGHEGDSCDGSSNTVAREGDQAAELGFEVNPAAASALDPASAARGGSAKGVTEVDKESSDVQSSASLSRRKRGRRKAGRDVGSAVGTVSSSSPAVSSGIDEEVSRPHDPREGGGGGEQGSGGVAKFRPLASFLEKVRSHEYGSLFNRRLPVQGTARYRSLIRQHIDLDSIHRRLHDSAYSRTEFFRDLLLLCANVTVFFARDSDDHAAGVALRAVVVKELARGREGCSNRSTLSGSKPKKQAPAVVIPKDEEPGAALVDLPSLLEKPVSSLVACRKRSAVSSEKAVEMKAKMLENEVEEEEEKPEKGTEATVLRGRVVEKPFMRGLRTSKGRGVMAKARVHPVAAAVKDESQEPPVAKEESHKSVEAEDIGGSSLSTSAMAVVVAKKRSATNFLKRLKGRAPSPSLSPADETPKMPPPLAAVMKIPKEGVVIVPELKEGSALKVAATDMAVAASPPQESAVQPKRKGRPPKRTAPPPPPSPAKRVRAGRDPVATTPLGRLRGGNRKRG